MLIFVRSHYNVRIDTVKINEANALFLTINNCISLLGIYRSPSYRNLNNFINTLNSSLHKHKNSDNIIITGDLNINIVSNAGGSPADDYLNLCSEHGFYAGNMLPTRGENCLDHVMIKSKLKTTVIVCNEDITDHSFVLTLLNISPCKVKYNKTISKMDLQAVCRDIEAVNWSKLYEIHDVNMACNSFCTSLTAIIKTHKKNHCHIQLQIHHQKLDDSWPLKKYSPKK